ncbi:hypothetical protein Tco_1056630 [Tanacetum coccineum]|uniref:Uncharacterized protein n=1 Tax=Tanacetum coccineum TaxID=301880 RepID=A0ABQ5H332_9ASTR
MAEEQPCGHRGRRGGYARREPRKGATLIRKNPYQIVETRGISRSQLREDESENWNASWRRRDWIIFMMLIAKKKKARDLTSTQPRATMKKMKTHGGFTDPIEIAITEGPILQPQDYTWHSSSYECWSAATSAGGVHLLTCQARQQPADVDNNKKHFSQNRTLDLPNKALGCPRLSILLRLPLD